MSKEVIQFIRDTFSQQKEFIPLHAPTFGGKEKEYLIETIDSTFVSSVGAFVDKFEVEFAKKVGAPYAIACVNGTNALHIALLLADVDSDDEVITQALTFIATANAISYIGAKPIFIDVDIDTLGLSPTSLENFLKNNAEIKSDGFCYNKNTGLRIKACVPMHTFGLPLRIDEVAEICKKWNISLVEDAAESLGSYYKGVHTGNYGLFGVFSFNGNKILTSGGGGALITDNAELANKAKHLTTQAKIPHPWRFMHDDIGYNYRMPNLNAALLCAQLEQLDYFLENKRELASLYKNFFAKRDDIKYIEEIDNAKSNYWLNAILLKDKHSQEEFLKITNESGVMTRPIWDLMTDLTMFEDCQNDGLKNSKWLSQRVVNIPSSVMRK